MDAPPRRRSSKRRAGVGGAPSGATKTAPQAAPQTAPAPVERAVRPAVERTAERTAERAKAVVSTRTSIWAKRTERLRKLIRDIISESRKINWPDAQTTRNLTIVVIGISVVLGLVLGGIDFVLLKILEAIP